ncbi:MAG: Kelch repeat-containing protein [Pirellulaceae bacterium]
MKRFAKIVGSGTVMFALAYATFWMSNPCQAQEQEAVVDEYLDPEFLPELPVGITSFGGAHCDGYLYVYGGHNGAAHSYYRSGQNPVLYRLSLDDPKAWEEVHKSPRGLQGLAMVAHNGKLYRMGGFEARNAEGEDQDLHSVADFEVLSPESEEATWEALSPLPEPRSSFDAVVVGDKLFVAGGWTIAGEGPNEWLQTAWVIDLNDIDAGWQELETPPFTRRALSLGFCGDKLYVIGGMQQRGGPTRQVDVLDLETNVWSEGPELPGEEGMEGFGNSSFNIGGDLVVSTYGGHVYKLNEAGDGWDKLGSLEIGRFFHRLLPISDQEFALVGGANMESGKTTDVEVLGK